MYWKLALIILLLWTGIGLAQLSGPLTGTYGPGTYTVDGNIWVAASASATILPGTVFDFTGPYSFVINGLLTAEGTVDDSIVFTTNPTTNPDRWRAINFNQADNACRLSYAVIEYGLDPEPGWDRGGGGLRIEGGSMVVSHCTIRYNECAQSGGGACVRLQNSVRLEYCLIIDNYGPYGGGIACNGTPTFDHCVIVHNIAGQGGGIGCWDASPTIVNCTIAFNDGDDASAIRGSNSHPAAWNTLFASNFSGPAIGLYDGSTMSGLGYCDFFDHVGGLVGGASIPGIGNITQTNGNGDPCDSYFNIFMDPLFVDVNEDNFYLMPGSPCIDAGNPASPHDPDGSVADIGALGVGDVPEPTFGFTGFVTLIDTRPTSRRFQLTHASGEITWLAFTGFCPGTTGRVTGPANPEWNVLENGDGNDGDSIIFVTDEPMTEGSVESFVLRYPDCTSDVSWCVGDTCGVISGSLARKDAVDNRLYQNLPNPFNPTTRISFDLAERGFVRLAVFNVMGQEVAVLVNGTLEAGFHSVEFDANLLPSGLYVYRLNAPGFHSEKKMVLVR